MERDERFDVVLQPQGNGVTTGNLGQATVVIVNDDGEIEVYFVNILFVFATIMVLVNTLMLCY